MVTKNIVKVCFENSDREYSYYSEEPLNPGDMITVPTKFGTSKARVAATGISEDQVEKIKQFMKTIPAGSIVKEERYEQESNQMDSGTLKNADNLFPSEMEPLATQLKELDTVSADLIAETQRIDHPESTAIIIINPTGNAGFINLRNSLSDLKQYAVVRVIKSASDIANATDDLAVIAKCKKELTSLKDQYIKPIRGHLDEVMSPFSELAQLLAEAELLNKDKIKAFTVAQAAKAAEIEAVNRQAEELARKQAELSGTGEFTVDTNPIEVPAPIKHVYTDSGTASMVKAPNTWELVDWDLVPKEYKILDITKIGKVVRAGGSIPGIKIIQQTGIRITTRQGV